jgi:hypothetical protein
MIKHKPTPVDFERQSVENLVQFFNLILEKEQPWNRFDDDESTKEMWSYHQAILKNALTLLFLAMENQLKKKICEVSPLLLLSENPSDWKTINQDKDFQNFHIRPFDDLITLYIELGTKEINTSVIQNLNVLRKKRNQITHAIFSEALTPKALFEDFAFIVANIWGERIWWEQYRKYTIDDPEYGIYDENVEQSWLSHSIEYLIDTLGKNRAGQILGVDFSRRRYHCPKCHIYVNETADNYFYKHAVLEPNTPESQTVFCVSCQSEFTVIRKDCNNDGCKGNVIHFLRNSIYEDGEICLTCGGWQDV